MAITSPELDAPTSAKAGRVALGRAAVAALRVLSERMDDPDPNVSMQAATFVLQLTTACLRHGQGLALDWAGAEVEPECGHPAPPSDSGPVGTREVASDGDRPPGRPRPLDGPQESSVRPSPCRRVDREKTTGRFGGGPRGFDTRASSVPASARSRTAACPRAGRGPLGLRPP